MRSKAIFVDETSKKNNRKRQHGIQVFQSLIVWLEILDSTEKREKSIWLFGIA